MEGEESEMQKKKSSDEGLDSPALRLGSYPTITGINGRKITFTDSCSSCGSRKRRCQEPRIQPRKKLNSVDPISPKDVFPINGKSTKDTLSTTVSPLSSSDFILSNKTHSSFARSISDPIPIPSPLFPITSPDPSTSPSEFLGRCFSAPITSQEIDNIKNFRSLLQSSSPSFVRPESFCNSKSPEKVPAVTMSPPPPGAQLNQMGPFSDSFSTQKTLPDTNPVTAAAMFTPRPPFLQNSVGAPVSSTTKSTQEKTIQETNKRSKSATVLCFNEEEEEECIGQDDNKMKGGNVKGGDKEDPPSVRFKCNCGRRYGIIFFC